ncbi:MAG: cryptochrome/photolyase family protein [Crocinitomicaceae bacterium]|jgi:deoxyribodipyrimidine photo-lyase
MNKTIFWHRRDLRIHDNAGLYKAFKSSESVQPIFIFDRNILDLLPKNDQRVLFIYQYVQKLKEAYRKLGSDLWVFYGSPLEILPKLTEEKRFDSVYTNRDYEPYALERDKTMFDLLKNKNVEFHGAKDHVIFEKNEVLKDDGKPYTVFTPYSRKWKAKMNDYFLSSYSVEKYFGNLNKTNEGVEFPSLLEMGFNDEQLFPFPNDVAPNELIKNYDLRRNFPSVEGTSRLSVHLRFGTISIRELARQAQNLNETFLNELIWRDFYQMIIYHFPHSAKDAFKSAYDKIQWEKNDAHFQVWCEGKTGYPLVDAGMRELNQTGFMHNRVRMVVASFLTKHLLLDWRWGEAYFAEKLMDFELASNVGGWQWAAGCGCDAAPYFRVFNPAAQQEKFDKKMEYIKKWVPEFGTSNYPEPIIDHKFARERVLERFKSALNETI